MNLKERNGVLLELQEKGNGISYNSAILSAISDAESELVILDETIDSIKNLKPQCDKLDYTLAACSGALCGLVDVFMVGKPGESPLGDITDKWFENRTCDFAKLCGWKGNDNNPTKSAIGFLERKFKVPYDQRGCGDSGSIVYNLTPSNHHFKSLAHNPTLLGLFFSILNQFTNTSSFVSDGKLITLNEADGNFELQGNGVMGKIWCGFVNWIGHLMSDISGSSGGKSRGTGIPSPLWSWTNSIIAIKKKLNLPVSKFDKDISDLAIKIYEEGYDARFQTTQAIPVLINEFVVRLFYAIRRLVNYYTTTQREVRSIKSMWTACEPFSNPTVKRMLTVAHGTFCLVDAGDATIRGFATGAGSFNAVEFFLRLNLVGVGRFTISLYGETKRGINYHRAKDQNKYIQSEKAIVKQYLEGLYVLKERYDDSFYLTFAENLEQGDYKSAFNKTSSLAKLRGAKDGLNTKNEIDDYFNPKKI